MRKIAPPSTTIQNCHFEAKTDAHFSEAVIALANAARAAAEAVTAISNKFHVQSAPMINIEGQK